MSSMPASWAWRISVRLIGHSWPWISPPRHCSAAAEMMPWNEPPMPTARWSLVPRMAASMVAVMSPSAITLMRAPASRISAIRSSCRGRSSTIAVMSPTSPAEGVGDRLQVLGDRAAAGRSGPWQPGRPPSSSCTCAAPGSCRRARRRPASTSAPTPPRATTTGALDRVERQLERTAAGAHLDPGARRCPSSAAADHHPAADRQRVEPGRHRLAGRLVGAARPSPRPM